MLDLINRLSHGFAAVPVIDAFRRKGLFEKLEGGKYAASELVEYAGANDGYLRVALRMLQGLGWVEETECGYSATAKASERAFLPTNVLDLYRLTSPHLPPSRSGAVWAHAAWVERSLRRWDGASAQTSDFFDGPVLIPLLLSIGGPDGAEEILSEGPCDNLRRSIRRLFVTRSWAEDNGQRVKLTQAGSYLLQHIFDAALIASYRPMFSQMDELLFGDCRSVFKLNSDGSEGHVDRLMNVQSSGLQHEKYFADAIELIVEIFDRYPVDQQPRYLMDTGCGDGSLLKFAYEAIIAKSVRGRALDQYPLMLIGVDLNDAARRAASRKLAELPHILIPGDVAKPDEILAALHARGVDPDDILHMWSFPDHASPEVDIDAPVEVFATSPQVAARRDGACAQPKQAVSSAACYLALWGQSVGRHGIVVLEVHCVDSGVANRYVDACESIYFDAFSRFSGQGSVDSKTFLMAAASSGLIPQPGSSFGYPRIFPFARITLNHFERTHFRIRHPRHADLKTLIDIERACWDESIRAPDQIIRDRIEVRQNEQFVVEYEGRVVAVLYTQPVRRDAWLSNVTCDTMHTRRDHNGDALQLLTINVLPENRTKGFADRLIEFVLSLAWCQGGVERVVAVSRTINFSGASDSEFEAYVSQRDVQGRPVDPVLRFHDGHGATILGPVAGFRPNDRANLSQGVAIQYDLNARPDRRRLLPQEISRPVALATSGARARVVSAVRRLVEEASGGEQKVSLRQPFMEMGFDSSQLLELRSLLTKEFGCAIDSSFLFRFNNIDAVAGALEAVIGVAQVESDEAPSPPELCKVRSPGDGLMEIIAAIGKMIGTIKNGGQAENGANWASKPFMEMGLDSSQLLELRALLSDRFALSLDSAFLFRHNTAEAVAHAVRARTPIIQTAAWGEPAPLLRQDIRVKEQPSLRKPERPFAQDANAGFHDFERHTKQPDAQPRSDQVAVVGMACRFSGGGPAGFWDLLAQGIDGVREFPLGRRRRASVKESSLAGSRGGYLDEIDRFDAKLFRMTPAEAELTDPQQRLLLELAWELFETAGYNPLAFRGSNTGVWIGACHFEYRELLERSGLPVSGHWAVGTFASILSNRLSYFFDLRGPSITVDTACSSSLVALHDAVRSIRLGTCEVAVVGGVNLLCGSSNTASFQHAGMLSPRGACRSFDSGADGYVRGEGGGLILLKRLDAALADGDTVYGVVSGTAVNHGGQASSLTAPNPSAQADVIVRAFRDASLSMDAVDYIEAHGSGTKLGDPIEIAGLCEAYQNLSHKRGAQPESCGIGSVKSNIGHLEGAAGIAGVIKVLLAMRKGRIPGNLHFVEQNPYINLVGSPFYIVSRSTAWPQKTNGVPRRAGVSSFGFGGANAHIVLEDFSGRLAPAGPQTSQIIILSAQSREQLDRAIEGLVAFLKRVRMGTEHAPSLCEIAWTLQVGRQEYAERLAVVADNLQTLEMVLQRVIDGIPDRVTFHGRVEPHTTEGPSFGGGDGRGFVGEVIEEGQIFEIARLWSAGAVIDWRRLWGDQPPRRVALPTYPFAREPYWLPEGETGALAGSGVRASPRLHPLLHENVSDLAGTRFVSRFTGGEFFLADHQVGGRAVLPGVAYLELARCAAAVASGAAGRPGVRLSDVAWVRPLSVDDVWADGASTGGGGSQVWTAVYEEADGSLGWEVYTGAGDTAVLHAQGRARVEPDAQDKASRLDLAELQARLAGKLAGEALYARLAAQGLVYGPAHRTVAALFTGDTEVLARLELAEGADADGFVLHPGIVDGALQAGLWLGSSDAGLWLPFAVDAVEVLGPSPAQGWAWVRNAAGGGKLDIEICDDAGQVRVRLRGLSVRALEAPASAEAAKDEFDFAELTVASIWEVVEPSVARQGALPGERLVIAGGGAARREALLAQYPGARPIVLDGQASVEELQERLGALGAIEQLVWLAPEAGRPVLTDDAVITGQHEGVLQLFRLIKALLSLGYGTRSFDLTVVTVQALRLDGDSWSDPTHASVHGLAGVLAKEYADWCVRIIDAPAGKAWELAELLRAPTDPEGQPLAWRDGEWRRLTPLPVELSDSVTSYRRGGVYVVVGGAGGIGEVWSEYMIRNYQARIVWLGRRAQDAEIADRLARLARLGPAPIYISVDAGERAGLERAYREIRQAFGPINGIVHSALVLRDSSLARMDEASFAAALSAKVDTTVRIAQVFAEEDLDFVLFFSSLLSLKKNPGQSNYTAGCMFADAFAVELGRSWQCAVKVINWGYWGSVGAVATEAYRERMARIGIGSIEPEEGMAVLERLLASPLDQLCFMKVAPSTAGSLAPNGLAVYATDAPSVAGKLRAYRPRPLAFEN